jgi:DNA repair exonuclease SbcCD ATPase subunit
MTTKIDLIRDQNNQLTELKDQYLRLQEQLRREQKEAALKLIELQREVRAEQHLVEQIEDEITAHKQTLRNRHESPSIEIIEEIWQILQAYRANLPQKRDPPQTAQTASTFFATASAAAYISANT